MAIDDDEGAPNLARRAFLAVSCACIGCWVTEPLLAGTPGGTPFAQSETPGFHRLMVGDYEVTALSDGKSPLPAMKLLQGDASKIAAALRRNALGEQVETSHNAFLVNAGKKLVLIDAGAGVFLGPNTGRLLGNLRAAGYRAEQVDEVYLTHMHTDHIGGLISEGKPAFPNAIVRADERDTAYWLSDENKLQAPADARRFFDAAVASLSPYANEGRLRTFAGGADLGAGIRARPAYGHTPGHTMYELESRGEKLLIWGDIVHVAAVQFADPTVTIGYDVDRAEAEQEHWQVFDETAKSRCLIAGAHLPFPGLGHVRDEGGRSYSFLPVT